MGISRGGTLPFSFPESVRVTFSSAVNVTKLGLVYLWKWGKLSRIYQWKDAFRRGLNGSNFCVLIHALAYSARKPWYCV